MPVEVTSATTDSVRLLANPDGTMTQEISAVPVRVRRGSGWVPVDTSLAVNADGSWSPRAAVSSMTVSGGGSGPFARFGLASSAVSLSWPSALPVPVVSGSSATYVDALPGVDLVVRVGADSFSEVLVVKTAAAAASSALAKVTFGLGVSGGTVKTESGGGFTVRNALGAVVMSSAMPLAWDSSGSAATAAGPGPSVTSTSTAAPVTTAAAATTGTSAGARTAGSSVAAAVAASGSSVDGPGQGAVVAPVGESVSSTAVSLVPPGLLTSASTVFPVYVDPSITPGNKARAMVDKTYPTTSYYNWTDDDQGVGYQNFTGVSTKRLWFQFPTSTLAGKHILSAQLKDVETWASSCTAYPVEAWLTGAVSSGTTWNNQPSWNTKIATANVSYGRAGCTTSPTSTTSPAVSPSPFTVEWDVTSGQATAAAAKVSNTTYGLRVPDETNPNAWKRFSINASLIVRYNTKPNLPTSLVGPGGSCATSAGSAPRVGGMAASTAKLTATATDPDGDDVLPTFQYETPLGAAVKVPADRHAGGSFTVTFLQDLAMNGTWMYRVMNTDYTGFRDASGNLVSDTSSWTSWCYFVVDVQAPAPPPVVLTNPTQPVRADGSQQVDLGASLSFRFGGESGVVGYRWALNGDAPTSATLSVASGAAATTTLSVGGSGPNTLWVWAYDSVGNQSGPTEFDMFANGFYPTRWGFNDTNAPPAAFDTYCNAKLTGTGSAASAITWSTGVTRGLGVQGAGGFGDQGLSFAGAGMAATTGAAPIVNTAAGSQPYTVFGWVRVDPSVLNDPRTGAPPKLVGTSPRIAMSVDGASGSVLKVGLIPDPGTDTPGAARFAVILGGAGTSTFTVMDENTPVTSDQWYQVTASVVPGKDKVELNVSYLDQWGVLSAVTVSSQSWGAPFAPAAPTSSLRLGSAKPTTAAPSTPVNPWIGYVDEVYALRGASLSTNGAVSQDLVAWMTALPPFGHTSAPLAGPCYTG